MFDTRSPRILHVSWGGLEVEGIGSGRDFKLWPDGAREWDWSETGTHHVPGIQPADVEELLRHGSEVVVLSRGIESRLETAPETIELCRSAGVAVHVEETIAAVGRYNELAEQEQRVGGLFHSTC
jgi:hypothetical protein